MIFGKKFSRKTNCFLLYEAACAGSGKKSHRCHSMRRANILQLEKADTFGGGARSKTDPRFAPALLAPAFSGYGWIVFLPSAIRQALYTTKMMKVLPTAVGRTTPMNSTENGAGRPTISSAQERKILPLMIVPANPRSNIRSLSFGSLDRS